MIAVTALSLTYTIAPSYGGRVRRAAPFFVALFLAAAAPARAEVTIDIHGFVSQGFLYSSANNYLARSADGSFEMTEVGVNFTVTLTDQLRAGMQLFDVQFATPHLRTLGVREISRDDYLARVAIASRQAIDLSRLQLSVD